MSARVNSYEHRSLLSAQPLDPQRDEPSRLSLRRRHLVGANPARKASTAESDVAAWLDDLTADERRTVALLLRGAPELQ
jgi:hypothetical protein